jgi:hypothetical protein
MFCIFAMRESLCNADQCYCHFATPFLAVPVIFYYAVVIFALAVFFSNAIVILSNAIVI